MWTGFFRGGLAGTMAVLALSSCGSPAPVPTAATRPTSTPLPRPSAAAGACASVQTTTAIAQVPAACAALWAPYGVTKVPPANLTDSTPAPPLVVNETNGAVSDGQLKMWILASNRDSVWYRWAEANVQPSLLSRLGSMALFPAAEVQALAAHESVAQPDCAIFPLKVTVFAISETDRAFFRSHGQTAADPYVFVSAYPGSCTVLGTDATGHTVAIETFPSAGVTFFASHLVDDPVLGPLLFADGAGNCSESGAPPTWCRA